MQEDADFANPTGDPMFFLALFIIIIIIGRHGVVVHVGSTNRMLVVIVGGVAIVVVHMILGRLWDVAIGTGGNVIRSIGCVLWKLLQWKHRQGRTPAVVPGSLLLLLLVVGSVVSFFLLVPAFVRRGGL